MIKPAERLSSVQEYYFSRKLKEVAKLNAEGRDIISLAIGSPDMPPAESTIDVLCREARKTGGHGYQPTIGTPELRQGIAAFYRRWYGVDLDPQTEVQPLIGSKEGILHVTLALVNVGDSVLVPNPGYPTYTALSRLLGANVVSYDLTEAGGWQPDFDQLEELVNTTATNCRILWSNYPHMPTGARARRETYERLVDFGRRHGIVVVNDNPYSFIRPQGGGELLSILQVPGAKDCCIEFNSMSKSFNMPGWRVGMLATNAEFIRWILKVKSNIDSGTFRAMQLAAADALAGSTEEWHNEFNVRTYTSRRAIAEDIMRALHCTFDPTQTGMFLWGRIPDSVANVEDLTERVLHEARVFIAPGFIFGTNGARYVRISLCAKDEQMLEALSRIEKLNFSA